MPDEKTPEDVTRDLTRVIPVFRDNGKAPDTPDNKTKTNGKAAAAGKTEASFVPIDKGSDTQMLADNTGFAAWTDETEFRDNTKSFTIPEEKENRKSAVRDMSVEIPDLDEPPVSPPEKVSAPVTADAQTSGKEADFDREMEASIRQMMQEEEFKAKGAAQARGEHVSGDSTDGMKAPAVRKTADLQAVSGQKTKKPKKKFTVGKAVALIVAALAILAAAVYFAVWNGTSYEMQLRKGKELYEEASYTDALPYLTNAAATAEGKSNVELLYMLADTQYQTGDQEKAVDTLTKLLGQQEDYSRGIELLAKIYSDDKNGTALNEMIAVYKGKDAEAYLVPYEVEKPVANYASGTYNNPITLTLQAGDDCWIYYTTDGSDPDKDSKVYTDPISLGKGDTQIKAVAMNGIGVVSEVLDLNYSITYLAPEAPAVTPDSGEYSYGRRITVSAEEGASIYYTLDGSDPTSESARYTSPVLIPLGNVTFKAVAVSRYGVKSSVTTRSYVVSMPKKFSYDESLALLKQHMTAKGELTASGQSPKGAVLTFTQEATRIVNNAEAVVIRVTQTQNNKTSEYGLYAVGTADGNVYKIDAAGNATAY
ncbi:MAG: chitobiase/beta-hexosaminidase C-terminal domain-containing protein [Lachnospiraceae bacterium]|jgi:tetratricopeptide (TPR) repeat protein|nr:chitobiase/beta-hexosaminidase C-terminal domain-containing protein [Lachnospiraceae bacterium]MCH4030265.1 chitobiase/beta-hexosaminidase C-terminal domain-containing protein [Lachnospiraceae bacterium]MCH4069477.1 chitobiase/beta-hexosaminidase C-terminal domain-containing protein [Lachnospiraceae bacterium]MCH4107587.1 chitobiase/beta-hexosaminidase C-terminal domain-containing protein [Lachnospiraceae bacterium]MCI1301562.1 chitobiase/beta-hexosaminidase C-terminal domain-containing prot